MSSPDDVIERIEAALCGCGTLLSEKDIRELVRIVRRWKSGIERQADLTHMCSDKEYFDDNDEAEIMARIDHAKELLKGVNDGS